MSELFTAITLEVLINGTWIDLWPDVLHTPAPKASRGIQSSAIEDRVADAGQLTFSLRNDASNSAGLIGRYSPGHANCLSGWTTSLPIRLGFSYDTWTRYKWAGRIMPDGIKVYPGTNAARRVDVTCEDFIGIASRHRMNLMTAQYDKYLHQAIRLVVENMPVQPDAIRVFDLSGEEGGGLAFPFMFDISGVETTALGEFQRIAVSAAATGSAAGFGYVVMQGDGVNGETLFATHLGEDIQTRTNLRSYLPTPTALASRVIRQDNTDFILLESGDFLLREGGSNEVTDTSPPTGNEVPNFVDADILPDSQFSYGKDITNHVTIVSQPRKIDTDATSVLWTLDRAVKINPSEQVVIRGAYNDPVGGAKVNGIDFVTPVAVTDYAANSSPSGTVTDMTASLGVIAKFGAAEVELTLSNSNVSTALYVGGTVSGAFFQVRGRGVYTYDPLRQITTDPASMLRHGVKSLTIDSKYIDYNNVVFDADQSYGETVIQIWKDPQVSVDSLRLFANRDVKNMVNFMFIESRWRVNITESMNGLEDAARFVQGFEFEIIDGQNVFWSIIFKNT